MTTTYQSVVLFQTKMSNIWNIQ